MSELVKEENGTPLGSDGGKQAERVGNAKECGFPGEMKMDGFAESDK